MTLKNYPIFESGLTTPRRAASRADAERAHEHLLAVRHERIEQLLHYVSSDGIDVKFDPSCLQPLNDWFLDHIEERKATEPEDMKELATLGGREHLLTDFRLTIRTESLVTDIALFIGELLICEAPHLYWRFVKAPKNAYSFQCTVLAGFQNVKNKNYYVDLEGVLSGYTYKFVDDGDVSNTRFVQMYEAGLRTA